jgi:hypothetical protein
MIALTLKPIIYYMIKCYMGKDSGNANYEKYKKYKNKYLELKKERHLEDILHIEYCRYNKVRHFLGLVYHREWKNILERFLNSMANLNVENRIDQVFVELPVTHSIYKKMIGEMAEKKIILSHKFNSYGDIIDIISVSILTFIENNFIKKQHTGKYLEYGNKGNMYYYGPFNKNLNKEREVALINRLTLNNKLNDKPLAANRMTMKILIILLRYASILAGGQNWNWPYSWYKYIHKNYDVNLEGFASPLNSQLLLFSDNVSYGSLFFDTDRYFGSIGNIFELDIVKYAATNANNSNNNNKNIISIALNPPYIEELMVQMVDVIDKWFTLVPNLRVFTGLPHWKDALAVEKLKAHKHLKFTKILDKGNYYYENSMKEKVKRIYPSSELILYVLSNVEKHPSEPEYEETLNSFK